MENERNDAESQARAQLECISELVMRLHGEADDAERAVEEIQEHPLSVEVRSGWESADKFVHGAVNPTEYNILLCTGGPAVRIIGELDQCCQPESARIQHQDWGTPWTDLRIRRDEEKILLQYASQFYYGE